MQTKSPAEKLLTPNEAAAILDMSPNTLAIWRSTGRYNVPYVKVGRMVRYRESDISAFIERRTIGAVA